MLVAGLGLGVAVKMLLSKPEVTRIDIVECNTDVIALLRMQLAGADQANASLHRQVNEMETVRAGATDWSEIADGVNRQLADSIASGSRMAQVLRDVHNQTSPASLQQIVTSNDTNLEGVPP